MGISENQISNAARMNTRQVTASSKSSVKTTAEKELELEKANALKANATKPGRMAAKANLVLCIKRAEITRKTNTSFFKKRVGTITYMWRSIVMEYIEVSARTVDDATSQKLL